MTYVDNGVFHMVVEVPHWSNGDCYKGHFKSNQARCEKKESFIMLQVFSLIKDISETMMSFPQTQEDPGHSDRYDPTDVYEIGSKVHARGEIIRVNVLDMLTVIGEVETNWKVIAVNVDDLDAAS
jgi:inorganic pyrophosphatase